MNLVRSTIIEESKKWDLDKTTEGPSGNIKGSIIETSPNMHSNSLNDTFVSKNSVVVNNRPQINNVDNSRLLNNSSVAVEYKRKTEYDNYDKYDKENEKNEYKYDSNLVCSFKSGPNQSTNTNGN